MENENGKYKRECAVCHKIFYTDVSNKQFCSEKCFRIRREEYWRSAYLKKKKKLREQRIREKYLCEEQKRLDYLIKECHLSYGKARAMLYLEHMKESEGKSTDD